MNAIFLVLAGLFFSMNALAVDGKKETEFRGSEAKAQFLKLYEASKKDDSIKQTGGMGKVILESVGLICHAQLEDVTDKALQALDAERFSCQYTKVSTANSKSQKPTAVKAKKAPSGSQ